MLVLSTWSAIGNQMLRDDDLMLLTGYGNVPVLVHLEGRIIEISGTRLDLETRSSVQDADTPVHGRIVVRLPEANRMLDRGDLISVKGWLHGIDHHESGEPDWRSIAVNGDYRGWMRLESNDLIEIVSIHEPLPWDSIKSYARDRLLSQPVPAWGVERTLLAGLLLGARERSWNEVSSPFRKTGTSHLLAISGLHVSLVLLLVMPLIRIGGGHRRWHSFAAMFFLAIYLSIIETRTPVIRAAIMSSFLYIPSIFGRRIPVKGVLAFTMSSLLVVDPRLISHISFQLSFGVVTALVFLCPHVERRFFPHANSPESNWRNLAMKRIRSALVVSTVAWLISLPITTHSFGQMSFVAVPMTMIMTPLICIILLTASVRLVLGWIETVDQVSGHLMTSQIHLLRSVTELVSGIRPLSIDDIHTDPAWATLATIWVVAWCLIERRRILLLPSFIALISWILIANLSG